MLVLPWVVCTSVRDHCTPLLQSVCPYGQFWSEKVLFSSQSDTKVRNVNLAISAQNIFGLGILEPMMTEWGQTELGKSVQGEILVPEGATLITRG